MDPYSIIAQYPNPGQAFSDSFQAGMKQNALSAFAMNPNPQTAGPAARYAPSAVLDYNLAHEKQSAELSKQHLDDWHKYAGELAKWADSPQKWDQAVDYLVQAGHPEAIQLKGQFNPALRAHFMALGGVKDENNQDPGMIREFDIATQRGLVPQGTSFEQYVAMRNPGSQAPVVLPQRYRQVQGGTSGAVPTATDANGNKVQYNAQSGKWEPMGGTSGNAGGGFPQ